MIDAGNFLYLPEELTEDRMLYRFNQLLSLNECSSKPILHVSINFHPDDTPNLSQRLLKSLSREYMEHIGMSAQPYVVYEHTDAGHPHIHLLCPAVKPDGHRIYLCVKEDYKRLQKALGKKYNLLSAGYRSPAKAHASWRDQYAQKVIYGEGETAPAIAKALEFVLKEYRFSSLLEFNSVLRQYNIGAKAVQSIYKKHAHPGLIYVALTQDGKSIGRPIASSTFYCKPTLPNLEKKFRENQVSRERDRRSLVNRLDRIVSRPHPSMERLFAALEESRIAIIVRHDIQGRVYDFTYVDHDNRCVFTESDLGKKYSATQLMANFGTEPGLKMVAEDPDKYQTRQPERPEPPKAAARTRLPRLSVASDLPVDSPLVQRFAQLRKGATQESEQERQRSHGLSRSF